MEDGTKMKWRKSTLDAILKTEGLAKALYEEQYARVKALEAEGRIKPLKSSKWNGMRQSLPLSWWVQAKTRDDDFLRRELYRLNVKIHAGCYMHRLGAYEKDRGHLLPLSSFLANRGDLLAKPVSVNERSFQIWGDEKFLKSELLKTGQGLIGRCGVSLGENGLNIYMTAEPLVSFILDSGASRNILVLENLDPFHSLRRLFASGMQTLFGTTFGTLLYGGGKRAAAAFREFAASTDPRLLDEKCRFFYFGDLDWEGVGIYRAVAEALAKGAGKRIELFIPAYAKMVEMAEMRLADGTGLPASTHSRQSCPEFFKSFPEELAGKILALLEGGYRVPQEIISIADWSLS